jgi:protein-tyrosine-phosphatase
MAETWFRHLCQQRQLDVRVSSAGLMAAVGQRTADEADLALARHGLSLAGFRSAPMTADLAGDATFIVAMTRRHAAALRRLFPKLAERVVTLFELLNDDGDVHDPIGGNLAAYEQCLASMKPALEALAQRLQAVPRQASAREVPSPPRRHP